MNPQPHGMVGPEDLLHMYMAWKNQQPVLVSVVGTDQFYLPVFDRLEPLATFLGHSRKTWDGFTQVDEPGEFLGSLPEGILVMVNPSFTDEGRVQWHGVL